MKNRHLLCIAALLASLPLFSASLFSSTFIFNGSVSNSWAVDENWEGGVAPPVIGPETDLVFYAPGTTRPNALFADSYTIRSMTFNDNIFENFTVNTGDATVTLTVETITIDSGVAGTIFTGGGTHVGSNNLVVTNNSAVRMRWENTLRADSTGQVQLRNGEFESRTGAANNSQWTGGTLIDNALWNIQTANAGARPTPFGFGAIVFGDVGSTDPATLRITSLRAGTATTFNNAFVVNSPDAILDIVQAGTLFVDGDINLVAGSNLETRNAQVTWLRGQISGQGDLHLGANSVGTTVVRGDNTFEGDVTISGTTQVRSAVNGLGDAANVVTVLAGLVRYFVESDGGSVTLDNDFVFTNPSPNVGLVAVPAAIQSFANANGDINLADGSTLTLLATTNPNAAQNLTFNLNGAIRDGENTANVLINGGGLEGSTSTFNLGGQNVYSGTTTLNAPAAGEVFVNVNGSLSNSTISIGAGTHLGGSGTLVYNLDGSASDLVTVEGTLDIASLTLDIAESDSGATMSSYIIADYAAGSLNGAEFANILNLPAGYQIDYNFNGASQIALVSDEPEESFQAWMDGLPPEDQPPPDQRGPGDQPAGDGMTNLLKYALGLLPMVPAPDAAPRIVLVPVTENGTESHYLALEFVRSKTAAVEFQVEASPDLVLWNYPPFTTVVLDPDVGDNRERILLRTSIASEEEARHFLSLVVTAL